MNFERSNISSIFIEEILALFIKPWEKLFLSFCKPFFLVRSYMHNFPFSVAFLSFGLGDPQTLSMITGVSLAGFGSLQVALYLKYPEFFESELPATA